MTELEQKILDRLSEETKKGVLKWIHSTNNEGLIFSSHNDVDFIIGGTDGGNYRIKVFKEDKRILDIPLICCDRFISNVLKSADDHKRQPGEEMSRQKLSDLNQFASQMEDIFK